MIIGPRASLATAGPVFAQLVNTTIQDNQNGVRLGNITPPEVTFSDTVIRNSRAWALGLYDSVVTLERQHSRGLAPAEQQQRHLQLQHATDGARLSRGKLHRRIWAGGAIGNRPSRPVPCGEQPLSACRCKTASTSPRQNCDFSSNLEFGLVVKGKANLQNCRFDANKNGIQLNQTDDTQVQLTNTTISNSQQYGVQAVDSQFVFDASTAGKWQVDRERARHRRPAQQSDVQRIHLERPDWRSGPLHQRSGRHQRFDLFRQRNRRQLEPGHSIRGRGFQLHGQQPVGRSVVRSWQPSLAAGSPPTSSVASGSRA